MHLATDPPTSNMTNMALQLFILFKSKYRKPFNK